MKKLNFKNFLFAHGFDISATQPQESRGLTEENNQLGMISPIVYFKSPIGDILSNWGLVICFLTLRYQTHISQLSKWIYYLQLGI